MLTRELLESRIAQYRQMSDAFAGAEQKACQSKIEADAACRELMALIAMLDPPETLARDEEGKTDGNAG